ncbi:hypothetical protein BG015_004939, partial [Linnemannia schmuckeri]
SSKKAPIYEHTRSSCEGTHGDRMAQKQSTHACSFHNYWQTSEHRVLNFIPRSISAMDTRMVESQNPGSFAVSGALGPRCHSKLEDLYSDEL